MKVVEILENFENILKEKNSLLEQRRLFEMKPVRNIEKGSMKKEGKTKRKEIYEEEKEIYGEEKEIYEEKKEIYPKKIVQKIEGRKIFSQKTSSPRSSSTQAVRMTKNLGISPGGKISKIKDITLHLKPGKIEKLRRIFEGESSDLNININTFTSRRQEGITSKGLLDNSDPANKKGDYKTRQETEHLTYPVIGHAGLIVMKIAEGKEKL